MIKNGQRSVVFRSQQSQPAGITYQTTLLTVLAFLFCVSAYSQVANLPPAAEWSPAHRTKAGASGSPRQSKVVISFFTEVAILSTGFSNYLCDPSSCEAAPLTDAVES